MKNKDRIEILEREIIRLKIEIETLNNNLWLNNVIKKKFINNDNKIIECSFKEYLDIIKKLSKE